jgi:predicted ATP-dependent endonuclease of OLD family
MRKYIRNFKNLTPKEQTKSDFLIEADIISEGGKYSVSINKNGFLEGKDHPQHIKEGIVRQCFRTRYDEELNTFQLRLDRWNIFKELFESVTGYIVEKKESEMSPFTIRDPSLYAQTAMMDKYVLELKIIKPNEIITDRECSKGEKKVLKNFTTLLNKDDIPSLILIDDVEMHVELDRHLILINCIEQCFPGSQTIFTTHSPKIIYGFDTERLQDLTVKSSLSNLSWRKKMIRIISKMSFFDKNKETSGVKQLLSDIRTKKDLDEKEIKNKVSLLISDFSNESLKELEGI